MSDPAMLFIRRMVRAAVILLVLGVLLNDAVRVINAFSTASKGLTAAADAAHDAAQGSPDDPAPGQATAAAAAANAGAELTAHEQVASIRGQVKHLVVKVAVTTHAQKTVLAAPIIGLVRGVPAGEWYGPQGGTITLHSTREFDIF